MLKRLLESSRFFFLPKGGRDAPSGGMVSPPAGIGPLFAPRACALANAVRCSWGTAPTSVPSICVLWGADQTSANVALSLSNRVCSCLLYTSTDIHITFEGKEDVAEAESILQLTRSDWFTQIVEFDSGNFGLVSMKDGQVDWDSTKLKPTADGTYKLVLLPDASEPTKVGEDSEANLTAFLEGLDEEGQAALDGAILISQRNRSTRWEATQNILAPYNVGAYVMIWNNNDTSNVNMWRGPLRGYIPCFTMNKDAGATMISENELEPGVFYNVQMTGLSDTPYYDGGADDEYALFNQSGRGPVYYTYHIKPDLSLIHI